MERFFLFVSVGMPPPEFFDVGFFHCFLADLILSSVSLSHFSGKK